MAQNVQTEISSSKFKSKLQLGQNKRNTLYIEHYFQSLTNYEDEYVYVEEKEEKVSPELVIIRNNLLRNVISN